MPNYHYVSLGGGGCGAGPGAPLMALPNPLAIPPARLINAQLRLGVYPGGGWNVEEFHWRVYSFCIGCTPVAGVALPAPAVAVAAAGAGFAALPVPGAPLGAANLAPSPVAARVDATEKGQIGYHMGTAVGGSLGEYLVHTGPATTRWFAFHLTRAMTNGATFNFAGGGAPDIVAFAVDPGPSVYHEWVVWENKGHCGNAGAAPLGAALAQAQLILSMSALPGGVAGGPWPPDASIASQVDTYYGNFRIHTIDPPGRPRPPIQGKPDQMDSFLRGYYQPFADLVSRGAQTRPYDGRSFATVALPKQIRFGLDAEILAAYRANTRGGTFAQAVARATSQAYANKAPGVHVHATGISVELPPNWRPSEGTSVPELRGLARLG